MYENRSDWKKELKQIREKLNENGNGLTAAEYFNEERIMNREFVVSARLKEKKNKKAIQLMEEYCKDYQWKEIIHPSKKEVIMNIDSFPESPARILFLVGLNHLSRQLNYSEIAKYSIHAVCGRNTDGIVRLLTQDLYPLIPYHIQNTKIILQGQDVVQWMKRPKSK